MKKWLMMLMVFTSVLVIGCSKNSGSIRFKDTDSFKTLTNVEYPDNKYTEVQISKNMLDILNSFANTTVKEIFDEPVNNIYSPISFYMALSMLIEGLENEAYDELSLFMGTSDMTELRSEMKKVYESNYYKNKGGQMRMANSMWLKHGYALKETFVSSLENYYYAEAYSTAFDPKSMQNIVDWINHYTNDLLGLTVEKYDIDTADLVLMLINTVYFDNKWLYAYDKKATYEGSFYGEEESQVDFMTHKIHSSYYQGSNYEVFYDYFENNNRIAYVLPDFGVSISSLLEKDIIASIAKANLRPVELTVSVPKTKYQSEYDLKKCLQNLGINNMFSSGNVTMIKGYEDRAYVSFIKQNAGIEFSEIGVKAAAVTSIGVNTESENVNEMIRILNRPFIYVIYDKNNIPLFIGTIYNPVV